ncbi:hypothetical protein [Nostoc sp.]|uniref:hypothetical protein n=1 Tax=Nostoc sp. TaxID=1180 RepID=UPI002FF71898
MSRYLLNVAQRYLGIAHRSCTYREMSKPLKLRYNQKREALQDGVKQWQTNPKK